jgi:glycine cleavage system aminomethyltransferase T
MNDQIDPNHKVWPQSPWVPYDPLVINYNLDQWNFGGVANAWEYTGWRDETQSWKTTAYIHGHLNPTPTGRFTGPDALKLIESASVNSLQKFAVGASRHVILTDDAGRVASHGMLVRTGEEEFYSYWLTPYLNYRQSQHPELDAQFEDLTGRVFLFQIGGPKALEILEAATQEDLHDIPFLRHRMTTVAGEEVRILRIGMAGTLAYELHGPIEVAQKVYQAVLDAGEPHGIRRLGVQAYMCNHTESGFPQGYYHMPYPWSGEDAELDAFFGAIGIDGSKMVGSWRGSVGDDIARRYRSPFDLGWGHMVNFNHEFPGKAALEKEAAENKRTMVTLVWNAEDITGLFATEFLEGEQPVPMSIPNHIMYAPGVAGQELWADRVLVDGRDVGTSSGRCYTNWSREMLSLATIEREYAEEGTEVSVLWGDPGTKQIEIRAKVARFPYLIDPVRNEKFDVSTIPAPFAS